MKKKEKKEGERYHAHALSRAGHERRQETREKEIQQSRARVGIAGKNENIRQMVEGRGRVPLAGSAMWKIKHVGGSRMISRSPDGRRESFRRRARKSEGS